MYTYLPFSQPVCNLKAATRDPTGHFFPAVIGLVIKRNIANVPLAVTWLPLWLKNMTYIDTNCCYQRPSHTSSSLVRSFKNAAVNHRLVYWWRVTNAEAFFNASHWRNGGSYRSILATGCSVRWYIWMNSLKFMSKSVTNLIRLFMKPVWRSDQTV